MTSGTGSEEEKVSVLLIPSAGISPVLLSICTLQEDIVRRPSVGGVAGKWREEDDGPTWDE